MGIILEKVSEFPNSEDFLDAAYTILQEKQELILIVVAVLFIFVLCLWTIIERLQKRGVIALIPVYRFVVLFRGIGLKPWLAVLMAVPGVNLFVRVIFYVYVARKFDRSYLMVPGLVLLPLVFLPIVAFGDGHCQRIIIPKQKRQRAKKAQTEEELSEWHGEREILEDRHDKKEMPEEKHDNTDDSIDHTRLLAMAELQKKRAEERALRIKQREAQKSKVTTDRMKLAHKEYPVANRSQSSRMPLMKQSPSSTYIAQHRAKIQEEEKNAINNKSETYKRLLQQQQLAQKKREVKRPAKRNMPVVSQKKPARTSIPSAKRAVPTPKKTSTSIAIKIG